MQNEYLLIKVHYVRLDYTCTCYTICLFPLSLGIMNMAGAVPGMLTIIHFLCLDFHNQYVFCWKINFHGYLINTENNTSGIFSWN